jgi:hypothetical protein
MMLKKILPFFSYLFHPLFIPVYAALFYFFANTTYYTNLQKLVVIFQIVMITILLPILFFFVLRASGQLSSMMVADISERKIPLVIQCFLTILLIRKSITLEHFPEFHFFFLGGLMSIIIALVLLFFKTKASLHMVAISGLTVFIIGLSLHNQVLNSYWIAFWVVMNGFVASSRLEMKAHTPRELLIGFIWGITPQLFLLPYWL